MTKEEYKRAKEILEEISECEYRIDQFKDLAECDLDNLGFEPEDMEMFIKSVKDAEAYINDLHELIEELKLEFHNL